jgi:prepilin-type N-terminal cleavage/methylation domain-containing protein/prepilin-type processing-associated H-X9-DG protein
MKLRHAFTLLELLITVAIIGILASMILPALSKSKASAQGAYCLNNGKQMMVAISLYTDDNQGFFPPNPDDGNTNAGYNWCCGSAGIGQPQEFNPDILKDASRSLLISYLKGDVTIFRCPADTRSGKYQGSDPSLKGKSVPAARTFSMSQAVGTIDSGFDATGPGGKSGIAHNGAPTLSVNGPWLNGTDEHKRDAPWRTFGKPSQINTPGPGMLWVLVDEDAHGLNDAAFAFEMENQNGVASPSWVDAPGTYHNRGCGFAFADGHSETHHWLSSSPKVPHPWNHITRATDHEDWEWMRQRTSSRVQ